jgi:hypothetical protein
MASESVTVSITHSGGVWTGTPGAPNFSPANQILFYNTDPSLTCKVWWSLGGAAQFSNTVAPGTERGVEVPVGSNVSFVVTDANATQHPGWSHVIHVGN